MAENSSIEWTDHTWNPWQGCRKVSQGCKFCYMYRDKNRYQQDPKLVHRSSDATFNKPLRWKEPAMVFTCSWSDFFIEEADEWRMDAFDIIRKTPHLTYQILTKRIERVWDWYIATIEDNDRWSWPKNAWLGVSVEDQLAADYRIPELQSLPFDTVKFLSIEPMLGFVDLSGLVHPNQIQWVITGGESGKQGEYRPANINWFMDIQQQCYRMGIDYFHKQNGGSKKINGVWGGREYDGETYDAIPKPLFNPALYKNITGVK